MKKLIATISTAVLIIMIPALFIGYLYNNTLTDGAQPQDGKSKIEKVNNQETTFTPGVAFILKG